MTKYLVRTEQSQRFEGPLVNRWKVTAKNETDAVRKILIKIGWIESGKNSNKEAKDWMNYAGEGNGEYIDEELIVEVTKI